MYMERGTFFFIPPPSASKIPEGYCVLVRVCAFNKLIALIFHMPMPCGRAENFFKYMTLTIDLLFSIGKLYVLCGHLCFTSTSLVIPRHLKKCGVLCFTLQSKNCVRVSVCLSVCPFVSASFSLSAGSIFNQFSSNLL